MSEVITEHAFRHVAMEPDKQFPCIFCGRENKSRTGQSAHERHCESNPRRIVSKRELAEQRRAANPHNVCPECEAEGSPRGFQNPGALAIHRAKTHGVKSQRKYRKAKNVRKPQKNGQTEATPTQRIKNQIQAREDLKGIVRTMYPRGIATDDSTLDKALPFIFETYDLLVSR